MNHNAYPHEIGPNQFLWLINARRDGNSVIPRGGQVKSLQAAYGSNNWMHPWQTHEGSPFRLWFMTSGCPNSTAFGETGYTTGFFDDTTNPRTQGVCYYHSSVQATTPREVSIGVYGGLIHVGMDNEFRKTQINFQVPYGSSPFTLGGSNFDELLKRFGTSEVVRRQYAFDGLYFLFLRQETGGGNNPNDTVDVYVWDSIAALPDDLTTFATAGDFPMGVAAADDYLYMVCNNGRIYYRGRGLPPKTWTLLGATGTTILMQHWISATTPGEDGQNGLAGHRGKMYYTDGFEAPSNIRSAVPPSTITLERTLPAGGICRTLVAIPRIGIIYPWHDQASPQANLKVGFYDSVAGTWTDTAKNLTAQDPAFTIESSPTPRRIMAAAYYRNRIVFMPGDPHIYISPPITIGDTSWLSGTWIRINDTSVFTARRFRNILAA
jgi:hypothetical protein